MARIRTIKTEFWTSEQVMFGDMYGYFGLPRREEAALDRGLADVNAELRKDLADLRAENKRLTAALEAISGTIAIYRAHQP